MATPDIGKLDLSDSDTEDLFASPSRASKPKQKSSPKSESSNVLPQRNAESKYDAEQARDAALRKELESVRSINEVIEGVVSSLDAAKGNMDVCKPPDSKVFIVNVLDGITHCHISLHSLKYLDPDPLTNGTQSKINSKSQLARRKPRCY
jgi:hypothetical protein